MKRSSANSSANLLVVRKPAACALMLLLLLGVGLLADSAYAAQQTSQQSVASGDANAETAAAAPTIATADALHGALVVTLHTTTEKATIHYTQNGLTPTAASPVYEAPFLVASDITVKAIAVAEGHSTSAVAEHTFDLKIPADTLVWSDEFTNTTGHDAEPNPHIWTYDTGNSGFGNNELENYCAWGSNVSPCREGEPNAYVGTDHYLHIVAHEPTHGVYTSARLKTQGLFSFRDGRLEFRARVPEAQGFWPAAWLLGNSIDTVNWPACGELDVLERVNAAESPD